MYRLLATGTLEELVYDRQLYKQQQSIIAQHGTRERRYFQGVQGGCNGELFGMVNLLQYTGNTVKTRGACLAFYLEQDTVRGALGTTRSCLAGCTCSTTNYW